MPHNKGKNSIQSKRSQDPVSLMENMSLDDIPDEKTMINEFLSQLKHPIFIKSSRHLYAMMGLCMLGDSDTDDEWRGVAYYPPDYDSEEEEVDDDDSDYYDDESNSDYSSYPSVLIQQGQSYQYVQSRHNLHRNESIFQRSSAYHNSASSFSASNNNNNHELIYRSGLIQLDSPNQNNSNSPDISNQQPFKVSRAMISQLKTFIYSSKFVHYQNLKMLHLAPHKTPLATSCSICMSKYKSGTVCKEMLCKHTFHSQCIETWLLQNANCPICRKSIFC